LVKRILQKGIEPDRFRLTEQLVFKPTAGQNIANLLQFPLEEIGRTLVIFKRDRSDNA
jgi:hypothetical protein